MKNSEKQDLKRKIGRVGIFLLIVFLPMVVVEVLLIYAGVRQQWIHVLVLVLLMFILFFLFSFVLSKLDKRKEDRMKKKKDPFSD